MAQISNPSLHSIQRNYFVGLYCLFAALLALVQLSNGQSAASPTGYEGFTHYVSYDDYDEYVPAAQNPLKSIRGMERHWDDQLMYIPELILEDPNPRDSSTGLPINKAPWGGTTKGSVFYSAFPGRSNLIRWKVVHPVVEGNCTIRLSNGVADSRDDFNVLQPVLDYSIQTQDGSFEYYSGEEANYYRQFYDRGKFAWGRADPGTFESITVLFPNMTCDECTLQLEVETKEGNIYQCADIEIINSEMTDCIGTCLNEGVWVNGKCICRSGFLGDHWQSKTQEKRTYTSWLVILFLIILGIIVAIVWYISLQFVSQKERWISKFGNPRKSKNYPDSGLNL